MNAPDMVTVRLTRCQALALRNAATLGVMRRHGGAKRDPSLDIARAVLAAAIDGAATPSADESFLAWLLAHCRIVYHPAGGTYPIEHVPGAHKDSGALLRWAHDWQRGGSCNPPPWERTEGQVAEIVDFCAKGTP